MLVGEVFHAFSGTDNRRIIDEPKEALEPNGRSVVQVVFCE
jgi:hypothetical protein